MFNPTETRLAELREVRAGLAGQLKKISSDSRAIEGRASSAGRAMQPSELAELNRLMARFDEIERELGRVDNDIAQAQLDLDTDGGPPAPSRPRIVPPQQPVGSDPMTRPRPGAATAQARVAPVIDMAAPVRPVNFAALFGTPAASRDELPFTDFLHALNVGDAQALRRVRNANLSTTGSDGGFAVPAAWSADLLNAVAEQSQFLRYCRVLPLTGQSTAFPIINETDRSVGPGSLAAQAVSEGNAATRQTIKFRALELRARKAMIYWSASSELLQDAVAGTDAAMVQSAASTLAMQIDREIWSGTGVGQMLGVSAAPATIVHAKDGSQSSNTVSFTNLSGMISRLLPTSWNFATWVLHPSTLAQVFGVYLATGTAGGIPAPMTQGPDGTYRLFGRPVIVSDFAAPLSSQGDVALVDLRYFAVGMREDLRFEVSRDFLFDSDEVAYRVVQRRDGQPILNSAVTPARGATTLSPFVVLAGR